MIKSISIYGCGYVGATIGYLLAKTHQVNFLDIDAEKINLINKRISPIQDRNLTKFIEKNTNLSIKASIFPNFEISDLHLVAVPTDYSSAIPYAGIAQAAREYTDAANTKKENQMLLDAIRHLGNV